MNHVIATVASDGGLPVQPDTKDFEDLRDRAAYVYATGAMPTHLRSHMTALLAKISRVVGRPTGMDGRGGTMEIAKQNAAMLGLDNHPMVRKVAEFVQAGFLIRTVREPKARRPYGKVFLFRREPEGGMTLKTVQQDGSVLDHW